MVVFHCRRLSQVFLGSASGISPLFVIRRRRDAMHLSACLHPHIAPCGQKGELKGWGQLADLEAGRDSTFLSSNTPLSFGRNKKTRTQRWIRAPYWTLVVLIYLTHCTLAAWADCGNSEMQVLLFMWAAQGADAADGRTANDSAEGNFVCRVNPQNSLIK